MKLQFSTRSLLLATAFIACVCGAYSVWSLIVMIVNAQPRDLFLAVVIIGPIFVPFTFIGYAIGRRAFSMWVVITFVVGESIALGLAYWAAITMKG